MFNRKEAPAIALGLLLFFCTFSLFAADDRGLSFSGAGGTLWVEKDGASGYWKSGLSYRGELPIYVGFNMGGIYSSLPWIDFDGQGFLFTGLVDTRPVGVRLSSAYFSHSRIDIKSGKTEFYNEGGKGSLFGLALPVKVGDFTIEPSYSFGLGSWDEGSFYWFFGKPDIPAIHNLGLSADYAGVHGLNFNYLFMKPKIVNQTDEVLFNSRLDCFTLSYHFNLNKAPFYLRGTLGWFYASGEIEGGLSVSNQHYFLFPYRFYNVDGSLFAHFGYTAFDMEYYHGMFRYHAVLGAVHGFNGEASAQIHYKKTNLFGGSERKETAAFQIKGLGAAFLLLEAGMPSLRVGRGKYLSFSINKIFAIPWGYENFSQGNKNTGSTGRGSSGSSGDQSQWLRIILLSGLSLNIKFIIK